MFNQFKFNVMTEKTCKHCGRTLPETAFYKCNTAKDGLQTYCKECKAEMQRERYQRVRYEKNIGWAAEELAKVVKDQNTEVPVGKKLVPVKKDVMSTVELVAELKRRDDFSLKDAFTPRMMINALYDLGYRGELTIMVEHTVRLSHE